MNTKSFSRLTTHAFDDKTNEIQGLQTKNKPSAQLLFCAESELSTGTKKLFALQPTR